MPAQPAPGRVRISKRLLLANTASALLTQAVQLTVLVWVHGYLVRRIPPAEYSTYFLVTALMAFAPILGAVLTSGQTRFVMEAFTRGDDRSITEITSTILPVVWLAALLVMALGGLATWNLGLFFEVAPEQLASTRTMMLLTLALFSLQLALSPFGSGLFVHQAFVLTSFVRLGSELLRIALLCALLLGVGPRVLWVVVAQFVGEVTALLVTVALSIRRLPALRFERSAIRWHRARELTVFGSWVLALNTASKMSTALGIFVLNKLSSPLQVMHFSLAVLPYRRLQFLELVASRPLVPVLTAMHAMDAPERLGNAYLRGGRLALWCIQLLVVPLVVFRGEVVELWLGPGFEPVATILALVLASTPLQYANALIEKIAIARHRVRPVAVTLLAMQAVHLLVLYLLVRHTDMGALGAGLVACCIFSLEELLLVPLGLRLAGVGVRDWLLKLWIPGMFPALVGGLAWLLLRAWVAPRDVSSLVLSLAAGALVYAAALFCALRDRDREDLKRLLARLRPGARLE